MFCCVNIIKSKLLLFSLSKTIVPIYTYFYKASIDDGNVIVCFMFHLCGKCFCDNAATIEFHSPRLFFVCVLFRFCLILFFGKLTRALFTEHGRHDTHRHIVYIFLMVRIRKQCLKAMCLYCHVYLLFGFFSLFFWKSFITADKNTSERLMWVTHWSSFAKSLI